MVMEEENMCCSLLDIADSVLQQPQQDPWTSISHQCINGEQQANVWGKAELQLNHAQESGQLTVSPQEERGTPEEAEPWEQIIWLVRPMTCASPPLSFATVQWDTPDPTPEASSLVTDSSVATELGSDGVTTVEATSLCFHKSQDLNDELFMREFREEGDGFDSQLLNSNLQGTGSDFEPCDAADAQDPTAQEGEESTLELLRPNNEIPRTDLEAEGEHSSTSDPVETLDFIDIVKEIEGSEDEAESFVDLKLESEQEELSHLLTAQGDSEEEQTSPTVVESEEENEEGDEVQEEKSVTDLSCREESEEAKSVLCLSNVEVLAEPLQSEDSAFLINEDELIDLKQTEILEESRCSEGEEDLEILEQLHEDPTGRSEEPEMCKDQNQSPKEPQAMQDNVELLIEAADNGETTEDSHLAEESTQPENADLPEECTLSEQTICVAAKHPGVAEKQEQMEPLEQKEQTTDLSQTTLSEQLGPPEETDESKIMEQLSAETEATKQSAETEVNQVDRQAETSNQAEEVGGSEGGSVQTLVANGKQPKALETAVPYMNGCEVDRELARRLAEQLFKLDGIQPVDVVKHLDKDNDFSRAVGEEYLKCFDFTGQTLDHALRSFLKVVVLIGETQERERVLQHFACRFHQCNPDSFSSSGAVLALTCALMLLNTDLHGQNVGKSMSSSKFVSNLDGMNEEENFSKDLLKSLYNSIKGEPLEWAIDEGELMSSVLVDEDAAEVAQLRSKANPFQDVPHDKTASEVKEGLLQRKLHADVDGKRTPWGKRGWKTFNGVLRGMVLYLQKVDYRMDHPVNEEVVSVHHSLAEQAADYTKKPHVFRLQTADWRVFLFQASCKVEMHSWISRINLVSALHSSPPFPAAVGSQRRFFRPILPAVQSAHSLERQLQSHSGMLESFKADLSYLQKNLPEGKKAKAKELVEHRVRAEYLQHEMCRYEIYTRALEAWNSVKKTDADVLSIADLNLFDKAMFTDTVGDEEEEEEEGLKKSHSTPALELLGLPPTVIKVKRNISERRTYRRTVIPRFHKDA